MWQLYNLHMCFQEGIGNICGWFRKSNVVSSLRALGFLYVEQQIMLLLHSAVIFHIWTESGAGKDFMLPLQAVVAVTF